MIIGSWNIPIFVHFRSHQVKFLRCFFLLWDVNWVRLHSDQYGRVKNLVAVFPCRTTWRVRWGSTLSALWWCVLERPIRFAPSSLGDLRGTLGELHSSSSVTFPLIKSVFHPLTRRSCRNKLTSMWLLNLSVFSCSDQLELYHCSAVLEASSWRSASVFCVSCSLGHGWCYLANSNQW